MSPGNRKIAHLFHWPHRPEYQQSLLQVIALPIGAKGITLSYNEKWVNKTFINEVENINELGGYDAIFWVLSCAQAKENDKVVTKFDFAFPLRLLKIVKVEKKDDYYYINFIAQEFMSEIKKINQKVTLRDYMKVEFDDVEIPYPDKEKGYAHIGPEIEIETGAAPSLEELYEVLKDIALSLKYERAVGLDKYPLLRIETIRESKISESGSYELFVGREYKVILSCYQGEDYRDRWIYINENRFIGKMTTGEIFLDEMRKGKSEINIEVMCDSLIFKIPLSVVIRLPLYKRRFMPLAPLSIMVGFFVFLFLVMFRKSGPESKIALIFALVVLLLDKFWEEWKK